MRMVIAIRQVLTVRSNGILEIRDPELAPGTQAEVIVLLESGKFEGTGPVPAVNITPLLAWEALQNSMAIDARIVAEWTRQAQDQRRTLGRQE